MGWGRRTLSHTRGERNTLIKLEKGQLQLGRADKIEREKISLASTREYSLQEAFQSIYFKQK